MVLTSLISTAWLVSLLHLEPAGTAALAGQPASSSLKTEQWCIAGHEHPLQLEIADTYDSRARGLMFRETLAEHAGMLFKYQQERPGSAGFWMYNTYLPLDIAYLDKDMKIATILSMDPCPSIDSRRCPVYEPKVRYMAALELNQGYFERYGITVGAQLQSCKQPGE